MEKEKTWFYEPEYKPEEEVWFIENNQIHKGTIIGLKYETYFYPEAQEGEPLDKRRYVSTEEYVIDVRDGYYGCRMEHVTTNRMARTREELVNKLMGVKHEVQAQAEHFINTFGEHALMVIEKTRKGNLWYPSQEELFEKVEEILKKNISGE